MNRPDDPTRRCATVCGEEAAGRRCGPRTAVAAVHAGGDAIGGPGNGRGCRTRGGGLVLAIALPGTGAGRGPQAAIPIASSCRHQQGSPANGPARRSRGEGLGRTRTRRMGRAAIVLANGSSFSDSNTEITLDTTASPPRALYLDTRTERGRWRRWRSPRGRDPRYRTPRKLTADKELRLGCATAG